MFETFNDPSRRLAIVADRVLQIESELRAARTGGPMPDIKLIKILTGRLHRAMEERAEMWLIGVPSIAGLPSRGA